MNFIFIFCATVSFNLMKKIKQLAVDYLKCYVRGGSGGQGMPSMGGHGGSGSNVYAVCREKSSLGKLKHDVPSLRFIGKSGERSHRFALKGKDAPDMCVYLPPGVVVRDSNGNILGELNKPNERVLLASGGPGGDPHTGFAGRRGQEKTLSIDLRLIADASLVGFPNAGKSSLLSAVSRARPRIASFPFTTLKPQLGNIVFEDTRDISIADLPGLIEGAHANRGLGHSFLKHIERTQLMIFVVDVNGFQLSSDSPCRSAFETICLLNKELECYDSNLLSKPSMIVLNKIDLPGLFSIKNMKLLCAIGLYFLIRF